MDSGSSAKQLMTPNASKQSISGAMPLKASPSTNQNIGFVIHGVSKMDMRIEHGNGGISQLGDQNTAITIAEVAPLCRKTHKYHAPIHKDIHTRPREANHCIEHGFNINCTLHHAIRYIPQVQI